MIISTKGRYGLRAVFEVAINQTEKPVSLKTIADKQELSVLYLEKLFSKLKNKKIIKSVRGAQGGYLLNKSPDKISVGEVIRALEGPLTPANCVVGTKECLNIESCVMHSVWQKIYDGINDIADSITLQDMLDEWNNKNKTTVKC
ncbi:MAG: Rrf2 family transcriptional regulator [Eubacteriales bacterium]